MAADASFVFWLVLVGCSFSRSAWQFKFHKASFFIHFEGCACGTGVRCRCTIIDRRHAERTDIESIDLFISDLRQVVILSAWFHVFLGASFSRVVVAVIFGQSLVSLGCYQLQPSTTLSSIASFPIGSFSRQSFENAVVGTTNY